MIKRFLIGLSTITLLGCQDSADLYHFSDVRAQDGFAPAPSVVVQETVAYADNSGASARKTSSGYSEDQAANPAGIYLAYRYGYGLVMPSASVKPTADRHIQMCRDAGPSLCQVTGSNTNSYSDTDIRASLSLRAEPEWLQTFVATLKTNIAEINGKIESENTSVEDLSRAILDTDARLKAQKTLRTRLENLLETRNAKLPDLLALERELARVQAEIESATANLKALRARVSMSVVNINYTSERVAVSRSSVSPIGEALKDFVGIVSSGLAGVIRFAAALLPWMIFVILPGLFSLRWFWRRRKKVKPTN